MKYFTTDTHFGHPLVSVLRGFTTFDPGHTQYDALLSSQGRKAAEDWVKGVVLCLWSNKRVRRHHQI